MFINREGRALRGRDGGLSARAGAAASTSIPRPSVATLAIVGIGFGLSIGSRIMAGFGVIDAVLALALLFVLEARREGVSVARAPLCQARAAADPDRACWPMR